MQPNWVSAGQWQLAKQEHMHGCLLWSTSLSRSSIQTQLSLCWPNICTRKVGGEVSNPKFSTQSINRSQVLAKETSLLHPIVGKYLSFNKDMSYFHLQTRLIFLRKFLSSFLFIEIERLGFNHINFFKVKIWTKPAFFEDIV